MEYIGELLKGVVIGIANILPGISGGMLAISMGVYDTIIHAVNRLFKEPVESIKTLFPYGLGAVAGIISLSLVFEYLFGTFPLQTKLAFIGLIGGGLPALFEKTKAKAEPGEKRGGKDRSGLSLFRPVLDHLHVLRGHTGCGNHGGSGRERLHDHDDDRCVRAAAADDKRLYQGGGRV